MENKIPSISVVVPVYKVEGYLARCMDSLLNQTRPATEIILVDDGSPDNSGKICDVYAKGHDNIVVIHKKNGGLSSARKAGWEIARGELIVFVDSDDYVEARYLELLSAPFSNDDVDLAICSYTTIGTSAQTIWNLPYSKSVLRNCEIVPHYILPLISSLPDKINIPAFAWLRMYRTSMLVKSDFLSEREYFTEDILLNILYAKRMRGDIAIVDQPLYNYCVNEGSLTMSRRPEALRSLIACHELCENLLEDYNEYKSDSELRLQSFLKTSITYCIQNISLIPKYQDYKRELTKVFSHPKVKSFFEKGNWIKNTKWHTLIYLAYTTGIWWPMYLLTRRKSFS